MKWGLYSLISFRNYMLNTLFCLMAISGTAQNLDTIKGLQLKLEGSTGKTRFNLLNRLAWESRSAFPDTAIRYATEAENLGRSINVPLGTGISLNYIGVANYNKGNYVLAFEFYDKALKEATVHQDSTQLAYANNNIGRLLSEQGMLTQSYLYFVKAQEMFEALHDASGQAHVYLSFGALYKTQDDFAKAELNYQRALQLRISSGNTSGAMSAMVQLGSMYIEAKRFDDGMLYYNRADSIGRLINDELALVELKIHKAECHLSQDNYKEAEVLATEVVNSISGSQNSRIRTTCYLVLGRIHLKKKNYAVAKEYLSMALSASERMKYLNQKMQSHYFLWKLSEMVHNQSDVLLHSSQYLVLKDSTNDIDMSLTIAQFRFQMEIERKQQELKSAKAESLAIIKRQNLEVALLISTVLFVSILFFFQWLNAKRRRAINGALVKQRDQIEQQAGEIKNQMINLRLQSEEIARMNETLEQRVRDRTAELENQNKQLTEYAFINSHLLRSPVAKIIGLINVLEMDQANEKESSAI